MNFFSNLKPSDLMALRPSGVLSPTDDEITRILFDILPVSFQHRLRNGGFLKQLLIALVATGVLIPGTIFAPDLIYKFVYNFLKSTKLPYHPANNNYLAIFHHKNPGLFSSKCLTLIFALNDEYRPNCCIFSWGCMGKWFILFNVMCMLCNSCFDRASFSLLFVGGWFDGKFEWRSCDHSQI